MFTISDTAPPLVLRPEGTAGVARALRAAGGKVWYAGPMFRRERPQRGRYRQFWQLGVEAIGDSAITTDVDVIEMADKYLRNVAAIETVLRVNTLGTKDDRVRFNAALREFLFPRKDNLSDISKKRFESGNVMRVLDSKLDMDIAAMSGAPSLHEFVNDAERVRFEQVKGLLTEAGVTFRVDETLVRGLDYYTSTAFEFDGPCGRAVSAGGRYDGVAGMSGVGFAIGLDRIEDSNEGLFEELSGAVVVVGLHEGAEQVNSEVGTVARSIVRGFRQRGYPAITQLGNTRLAKSVSRVIKSGAAVVVVVGETEVAGGFATVKYVRRDGEEDPVRVPLSDIFDSVCERVSSETDLINLQSHSM